MANEMRPRRLGIRKQRSPRPGEVLSFVALRRGFKATPEEGKSGPQVRVSPAPCCGGDKRGGSVVISTQTGLWTCFKCTAKGNWYGFTKAVGIPLTDPYEDAAPIDFSIYEHIRARLRRPVTGGHYPGLLALCASRGLTAQTLNDWRVSSMGSDVLRFPLFALAETEQWVIANSRMRKVIGREAGKGPGDWFEVKGGPTALAMGNHLLGTTPPAWTAERPSWSPMWLEPSPSADPQSGSDPALSKRVVLSNQDVLKTVKRVLIVEGQWDAMTAWQLGCPNVLSLPNGASHVDVSGLLRYVPEGAEVWLAVDMDEAGDRAAEAVFAQLGTKVTRLLLPHKDLNAWLMAEPGLTIEQVFATAGRDLAPVKAWVPLLRRSDRREDKLICDTPWERLTRRLRGGWPERKTTGILAPSGYGKTTITNNIAAQAIKTTRCGIIQLEGTPKENAAVLAEQVEGWLSLDLPERLPEYLSRLMLSPLCGKHVQWRDTISETEALIKEGARLIVIDNWDYITSDQGREKVQAYGEFQELCKRYDVHGIVVWQPAKVDRGRIVNSGDQKGMSKMLQDADIYMTLNKFGLCRRLDIEKVRGVDEVDLADSVIWLKYDAERKSMFETESQADLKPVGKDLDFF